MDNIAQVFVGIDISKDILDVHINETGEAYRITNDVEGIKKLIRKLSKYDVTQVAYESTGGYEYHLSKALRDGGYSTWQVDPRRIRAFIISEGIRAKTDKIDASMIALFASQKKSKYIKAALSEEEELLVALTKRRTVMVRMLATEKVRMKHPSRVYCQDRIQSLVEILEAEVKDIAAEIEKLIKRDMEWSAKKAIITSVPGMGDVCSAVLISSLPELGALNGKEISALIGVAPYIQQSGSSKGIATIRGGRELIRNALYMASITAIRFNPKIKEFYERLRKTNKCFKVAIVAVMRKIIVILNAMLRHNEKWRSA